MSLAKKPAKTRRGKRALARREPKVNENTKTAMFIPGPSSDAVISACMKDLAILKQPDCVKYSRKTTIRPFEDETPIHFYSQKSDCSLFAYGSSSKKRPANLILGRLHNYQVFDMAEFGISNFQSLTEFPGQWKPAMGSKPCFVLDGPLWQSNEQLAVVGNLIVDFFRGRVLDKLNLAGLDHVVCLTASSPELIHFRHYGVTLKKSGSKIPRPDLIEVGPHMDLTVRRTQFAPDDMRKEAEKVANEVRGVKRKNVSTNVFGEKLGRIHMPRQELNQLRTNISKQAKKKRKTAE